MGINLFMYVCFINVCMFHCVCVTCRYLVESFKKFEDHKRVSAKGLTVYCRNGIAMTLEFYSVNSVVRSMRNLEMFLS